MKPVTEWTHLNAHDRKFAEEISRGYWRRISWGTRRSYIMPQEARALDYLSEDRISLIRQWSKAVLDPR